jgi:hypothetical protein
MTKGRTAACAALALGALIPGCASSPQVVRPAAPDPAPMFQSSGGFVVRLGNDTVAVERFTRTATTLDGQIVTRAPSVRIGSYSIALGPDGLPTTARYSVRQPDGQPVPGAPRSVNLTFGRDSVTLVAETDSTLTRRVAAANAFPVIANSFALYELYVGRLLALGADSLLLPVMPFATAGNAAGFPVVRRGPREAAVYYFGSPQIIRLGDGARIESVDARQTTFGVTVERTAPPNIAEVAARFAGARLVLSPRDTVRATIGGANLLVDYGRPFRRGREVFGSSLVPWNQVWRLGANAATQLVTDREIMIGDLAVPPGTYTLFAVPSPGGWQLIVNRQTGQWGTEHDPARDLGRVNMAVTTLGTPVEQFTIDLAPQQGGGSLRVSWDTLSASVPIRVR